VPNNSNRPSANARPSINAEEYTREQRAQINTYKALIRRKVNGQQNVEFGIDPTDTDAAMRKIHLLRRAFEEEIPERTPSKWWWILHSTPFIGMLGFAIDDRNIGIMESKVKDELAVILQSTLENCVWKINGLENRILAMQEQLRSMEERNVETAREHQTQLRSIEENHTAKLESMEEKNVETAREHQTQLRSMESNFSKAMEALSRQISSLKENNQERGENWEMMIVNKEEVGRGL
jgi:hypothetical protein